MFVEIRYLLEGFCFLFGLVRWGIGKIGWYDVICVLFDGLRIVNWGFYGLKIGILVKVVDGWWLVFIYFLDFVLSRIWKLLFCVKVFWEDKLVCSGFFFFEDCVVKCY